MEGYVKNKSPMWTHAMKRAIGPGATISLDELYKQYGAKHNLAEGDEFINWLKTVKLKDTRKWEVVLGSSVEEVQELSKTEEKKEKDVPIKQLTVEDIVQMSVRKAREVLPKITDLKLLQYALDEAGPRAGKDSLCRILRKRIQDIKIAR